MGRHRDWQPGDTSIKSARMYREASGRWAIYWRICAPDGRLLGKHTRTSRPSPRMRKGSEAYRGYQAALRERAEETAQAMRDAWEREADDPLDADDAGVREAGDWKATDSAADYVGRLERDEHGHRVRDADGRLVATGVSFAALLADPTIRDSSRERYAGLLEIVSGMLRGKGKDGRDRTIGWLCRPRNAQRLLKAIERAHGTSTARHCRAMLSKYVYAEMETDELVDSSPLARVRSAYDGSNHGTSRRAEARRDGTLPEGEVVALTAGERARCVRWLLADPCEAPAGRRGGTTREEAAYRRRELVELTLLQATCGLRLHECLTLAAGRVGRDSDGMATVEVTDANSKTGRGRVVGTIDPAFGAEVSGRLLARVEGLEPDAPVFGACKDPSRPWDAANARKALRRLYDEMADALGIETLRVASTHVWRATLNGEYADLYARGLSGMDETVRTSLFGHTGEVERDYYTKALGPEEQRRRASRPGLVEGGATGGNGTGRSLRVAS